MAILSREQIEALRRLTLADNNACADAWNADDDSSLREAREAARQEFELAFTPVVVLDLLSGNDAYHDLRDAVLALCDEADRNHEAYLAGIIMDRFIVPSNVTTGNLREVVARVERGTDDAVS